MKKIEILEKNDRVRLTDYCRPLTPDYASTGDINQRSPYSGRPINNLKWARVAWLFGTLFYGRTAGEINGLKPWEVEHPRGTGPQVQYEFARGELPASSLYEEKKDPAQ